MGRIGLRHHQTAGSILIQPVNNPGPLNSSNPRQLALAVMQERIDHSPIGIARSWMNDHAMGLVDDNQVLILVQDTDGNVLRDMLQRHGFGDDYLDEIAVLHAVSGLGRLTIQGDVLLPDQGLDSGARQLLQTLCQIGIEPSAPLIGALGPFSDSDFHRNHHPDGRKSLQVSSLHKPPAFP